MFVIFNSKIFTKNGCDKRNIFEKKLVKKATILNFKIKKIFLRKFNNIKLSTLLNFELQMCLIILYCKEVKHL